MTRRWKRIILLAAIAGAVALIGIALRPAPLKVETARVVCGSLRVTIDAEGKTRARDRFVVAAPITGRLARINLRRGDQVVRDQVIARIDPLPIAPLDPRQLAEARARVTAAEQMKNQAETIVERARVECEQARRELARAEKLVETGDIARQEFERIRSAEQTCRRELEAARYRARAAAAEVDVAKAALIAVEQAGQSGETVTVVVSAPVQGRVLRVIEESERVVNAGTPLMELSNPSLEIVVDVLSADAVKVKLGAAVMIEGWGGEQPLEARVRLIEPQAFTKISALGIEEQRVNVIADFIDPPAALGDGYRVEARIVIWEAPDLLKVPVSALFRHGQGWSVFIVENGIVRRRDVEIGHRTTAEAEIVSGLKQGEVVIPYPSTEIAEGMRIELRESEKK
ncbi:MAG: efflux RND transporter periplasmic adaptor subunit [Acidobacteria bacterium]|nr:efflux RND transporter periplasmic adaptor subunit [Acidobacteriota bacterium]